jgi:hypothetical protein
MPDICTQTDPAPPPAYNDAVPTIAIEGVERLKRFLVYCLNRDYNAGLMDNNLSFREHSQWHDVGYNPVVNTSRDRIKFEQRIDDYIESPCKLAGITSQYVWIYVLAQGKNFFRDSKFRGYVRDQHQQSPQNWAKKLLQDRDLVLKISEDAKIKGALLKAIDKEVSKWFAKLEGETEWQLTSRGESQWSWKRTWM